MYLQDYLPEGGYTVALFSCQKGSRCTPRQLLTMFLIKSIF